MEKKNPKAYKDLEKVKLYAAHSQQPNKKPAVQDMIDDEALSGLVDIENLQKLEDMKLEDDDATK
jgi:queuine tRNA-ribosyltransferase